MDLTERMGKFNKRWSSVSHDSYEESFKKFKTRILNIFKDIDRHVTKKSISLFCQYLGIREIWNSDPLGYGSWSANIISRLTGENDEIEFYRLIEIIFSLDITSSMGYGREPTFSKEMLVEYVTQAIDFSSVNVAIAFRNDEVMLFRKGEEMLDEQLVNQVISFLNTESNEHFESALKFYQAKNPIKSAESLRRSLEEFLRYKLNNTLGLNVSITEMQKRLKVDGRDAQIRNIIFSTFSYLDTYFNENSKHHDGDIDDVENEFLIYETGTLLRYINRFLE